MNRRRTTRSTGVPTPSFEAVKCKILHIAYRHEQLKVSFDQLRSQISTGLLETEDVFASLALQLMKLVGLKSAEMAEEKRFSTVVTSFDSSQLEPEYYMEKVMEASNEVTERQKFHLLQLISILKNIEAQVKSSQMSIFQDLANNRNFIKSLFVKALAAVSSVHCPGVSTDLSHMMQRILKATFLHVGATLDSVEVGVEDLITELAKKMCSPMVQYVQGLKVEMQTGANSCLLEVVKEMHEAMQVRRVELEEAKKQTRLAEQKLMKQEETAKKLMPSLLLTMDTTPHQEETSITVKEDQAKDDNLIWELLRQKKKARTDCNPVGPNELLSIESLATSSKKPPSKRVSPLLTHSHSHTLVLRSQLNRPNLRSSSIHSKIHLGSSPSATTHKVLCGKRVHP